MTTIDKINQSAEEIDQLVRKLGEAYARLENRFVALRRQAYQVGGPNAVEDIGAHFAPEQLAAYVAGLLLHHGLGVVMARGAGVDHIHAVNPLRSLSAHVAPKLRRLPDPARRGRSESAGTRFMVQPGQTLVRESKPGLQGRKVSIDDE